MITLTIIIGFIVLVIVSLSCSNDKSNRALCVIKELKKEINNLEDRLYQKTLDIQVCSNKIEKICKHDGGFILSCEFLYPRSYDLTKGYNKECKICGKQMKISEEEYNELVIENNLKDTQQLIEKTDYKIIKKNR